MGETKPEIDAVPQRILYRIPEANVSVPRGFVDWSWCDCGPKLEWLWFLLDRDEQARCDAYENSPVIKKHEEEEHGSECVSCYKTFSDTLGESPYADHPAVVAGTSLPLVVSRCGVEIPCACGRVFESGYRCSVEVQKRYYEETPPIHWNGAHWRTECCLTALCKVISDS